MKTLRGLRRPMRRLMTSPPSYIAARLRRELTIEWERLALRFGAEALDEESMLAATEAPSLDRLWSRLRSRPYVAIVDGLNREKFRESCQEEEEALDRAAATAMSRVVDLLGSGPTLLGTPIDWHRDYKSGVSWSLSFGPRMELLDLERPSDVKFPWELSRLQWMIPVGQAFLLTPEERYALAARATLEEWIEANPFARGVNWAIAMESALRIVVWTWLFHVFAGSAAWGDSSFRKRFLTALYLHGRFTARHLEKSDVNGNHYLADAVGLVFAGLFFGEGEEANLWQSTGWRNLCDELPRQVHADGVDFEASSAYHRLATELFLLPALYRQRLGLDVPEAYRDRLISMTRFVSAYTRPDGSAPAWGDADDGRVLPLGRQGITDHRYLVGLVAVAFNVRELFDDFWGPRGEIFWLLGTDGVSLLPKRSVQSLQSTSAAFQKAGVYVMRGGSDHVFVDCGAVGFAGRGGHGHNDCLSFEATLADIPLVVDSGSYVYSASYEWRNRFRGTAFHNTPVVDDAEQNRFVDKQLLWMLHDDVHPSVLDWLSTDSMTLFRGSHDGYRRLPFPVTVVRTLVLDSVEHGLVVSDEFDGQGEHDVHVSFHLHPEVHPVIFDGSAMLRTPQGDFAATWTAGAAWQASLEQAWVSPSYGVLRESRRLQLSRTGSLMPLVVAFTPARMRDPLQWADERLRAAVRSDG